MRVTNAMIKNNMMLGLNKNMAQLNTLYDQMNSLKKIQRPSDDPIILGRSLKLRLNVLETDQYKTNVGEAKSWMEVSDKAIENVHSIINDIRKQCLQAANDTLKSEDRQKIMETINQLRKQITQESNANYAGRNVFGGYKTDKKILFDKNIQMENPVKFEQSFGKENVEIVDYREEEYYRIRLPYGDVEEVTVEGLPDGITLGIRNSTDIPGQILDENGDPVDGDGTSYYHPNSSDPEGPGAYFLKDTGEFIISKDTYDAMGDITISYEKTNFKEGDPNPEIFFNTMPDSDEVIYTGQSKSNQNIEYEIGIGTKLNINALGKEIFDPYLLRDIDELVKVLEAYNDVENNIEEGIRDHQETINLSKLFTGGVGKIDKALKQISGQQADLGSRMKRLELTEKRLGDDEISFTELLSRTEDVELERVYIDFNTQFNVYQSALQATARVVQPTLMDFLR